MANHINFSMPDGELRCLIGPNGAGKTTFFNLVTGIVRPFMGNIYFTGQKISNYPSYKIARLGISRSFQVSNIYNGLSVFENIRIAVHRKFETFNPFRSIWVRDEIYNKVVNILETFHLSSKKDFPASTLSHGEKRKLELGISVAYDPKLLLLDEPAAGLTTSETEELIPLIKGISSKKVSILIIEHDMKFVKIIADRITVLHRGEILAEGSPEEIEENEDVKNIYLGGKQDWY